MQKILIYSIIALASPAFAQQGASVEDIQSQRNQFMGAFAQCDTLVINIRHKLTEAEARIKELEKKYEPKNDDMKK